LTLAFDDAPLGDGVTLALRRPEHTRGIFEAVDRSRDHLRPWFPWVDLTRTVADVESRYAVAAAQHARGKLYEFVILDGETIVGKVDLHSICNADSFALLGYWLSQEAEGRGLMTPAIAHVIAFASDDLGLQRLELRTSVTNARSRALAERLGFHLSPVPDADPRGDMGEETVRYIRSQTARRFAT
jgi:ribosomal-protein-serine acetyltransferase